jgi:hypothetical protein
MKTYRLGGIHHRWLGEYVMSRDRVYIAFLLELVVTVIDKGFQRLARPWGRARQHLTRVVWPRTDLDRAWSTNQTIDIDLVGPFPDRSECR